MAPETGGLTPEQYAERILARITMIPQGRWDADVVEFETASMGTADFAGLIAAAIRDAVAAAYEDAMLAVESACTGFDGAGRMDDINAAIRQRAAAARSAPPSEAP